MPKMELALRRSGQDNNVVELIWRGGETARGARRVVELEAGVPLEGKPVTYDAIAQEVDGLGHGAIVTADCSFQAGRGFVADRVVSIEPFTPSTVDDLDALELRITTLAEAGKYSEAGQALERLLDLEPKGTPLPPVSAAVKALGNHLSARLRTRVAEFYGVYVGQTRVFPTEIPLTHWPVDLLVAYGKKLVSASDREEALTTLTSIIDVVRKAGDADALEKLVVAAAKLEKAAGRNDEAIADWRSRVLAKGTPLDLGKTVALADAHLRDIGVTAAVRKLLLATALPARVAPQWRATITKAAKPLPVRAKGYYAIGVADGPEDEQVTATLAIDGKGRVYHIVDDGDPRPEAVASSLAVFATRLHVMRSYLAASKRLVGKGKRSEPFETAARAVLERVEPSTMDDYWDPEYWVVEEQDRGGGG